MPALPDALGIMHRHVITLHSSESFPMICIKGRRDASQDVSSWKVSRQAIESFMRLARRLRIRSTTRHRRQRAKPFSDKRAAADERASPTRAECGIFAAARMHARTDCLFGKKERDTGERPASPDRKAAARLDERDAERCYLGAQKRTRTSTVLPPLGPEPSASTNSAIWASS
jgi:hypothetical protein